jgi:GNAT superfamily N-acetyltransferase
MYVDPAWRRHGLGRRLLRDALRWARRQGAGQARLDTASGNRGAQRLYGQAGFRQREVMYSMTLVFPRR